MTVQKKNHMIRNKENVGKNGLKFTAKFLSPVAQNPLKLFLSLLHPLQYLREQFRKDWRSGESKWFASY